MSYTLIDTVDETLGLAHLLKEEPTTVFCDIESTGLDFLTDNILLLQIKHKKNVYIVDVRKVGYDTLRHLVGFLSNSTCVFHNTKFDLKFLYHRTGIMLSNVYDTMTAEAILNSGIGKKFYSLEELAEKYADTVMNKEIRMQFVNMAPDASFTEQQLLYSALDVTVLQAIHAAQMIQFIETKQQEVIKVESDLIPIVALMEYDGIRLDTKMWLEIEKEAIIKRDILVREFSEEVADYLINFEGFKNLLELAKASHIVGKNITKKLTATLESMTDLPNSRGWIIENFNEKSNPQLLAIFHLMKIKCKSTNEKVLEAFKNYPIVGKLIEIRGLNKQIDQYGSNFLKHLHSVTGKIHTEYFTVGTQTGRFSSNNPNLQNVPTHGGYRECFIPEEDFLFAAVDYSQQEYRLAGAISGEKVIIDAYKSGSDMHTATGKIVAKKDVITKDERNRGKTVNFAILYGSTEWGLKKNLKIDIDEAKQIIKDFWDGYPRLAKFMELAGNRIMERGYSITPLGRRRYNEPRPTYGNTNDFMMWREQVLREGKNHIIQGGGADILKIAMVQIAAQNPFGRNLRLTLQIHDELVVQLHKSIANEGLEFIKQVMLDVEQKFLGEIPAAVEGELHDRWSK